MTQCTVSILANGDSGNQGDQDFFRLHNDIELYKYTILAESVETIFDYLKLFGM